jgi:hypothetical protein
MSANAVGGAVQAVLGSGGRLVELLDGGWVTRCGERTA